MSQAGALNTSSVLPDDVPTSFVTDAGTAIPALNTLNVIGGAGITTSAVGDTVTITATGSGGDVVGPASATDTAIAIYDGTTGKLIQNSLATVNTVNGNIVTPGSVEVGDRLIMLGQMYVSTIQTAVDYIVLDVDTICYISVTDTTVPRTITLPLNPLSNGRIIYVKDASLGAATNNITIDGNTNTIIGTASAGNYVMDQNGQGIALCWSGTDWQVYSSFPSGSNAPSFTWSSIIANQTLAVNNGYFCKAPGGALSLALPAVSAVGDTIKVYLDGSTSFTITQSAGQSIKNGFLTTTAGAGGSMASTGQGDSFEIICSTANLKWNVVAETGNFTMV